MKPLLTGALLILTCFIAAAQMKDFQGYKDPALFTRMPHYFLPNQDSIVETPFDAYEFPVKNGTQRVEGRHLHYTYDFDESAGTSPGFLQIVRNYQAAAKKIGGEILSESVRQTTIRIAGKGQETWVGLEAFNEGRQYELNIIERQSMKQDVVADAAALRSGLTENGHVEVPGIFFDFGKSDIKPESEPALKELTAMLQAGSALKVWVVGHTDNVGSVESNMTLSGARAAAVVKSLVQRGIGASRLAPHGAGPYAPVASNATDEGRARNRRVELVAQP
jgi:outer membrane protein OmpA-like peptidoglycan-associated protein